MAENIFFENVNSEAVINLWQSSHHREISRKIRMHALFIFRQFNPRNLTGCHQKCRTHFQAVVRQCRTTVSA
ncbi:hypothetical protein FEC61_02325 [Salmonella enterica]|nr:hypothetical protein [Salmonella enterica]EBG2359710.1 hypothetical protein [Salmonella enterica subsp. enterica serovar Wien]ECL7326948.1 hypothetical protein [Salmonella enterica subsp. enterica serovar Waycross]EDR0283285.1 hypothetical protein [Salmonella enterica subsp. enterica]EDW8792553.1 hypothetical protein [Salmonella enterica subsp. enterica serovar Nyanza]EHA9138835.1 hypothetical protein [Salmonella enterica subsp. enterica serovar Bochum]